MERPERDEVFITMCIVLSHRGSCNRAKVGAIIVKEEKHVIASGVNGPNNWDCDELKCDISKPCNHAIHAEENAINFAGRNGVDLKGSTLYCTHGPCINCAKLIVREGISRVVYLYEYRDNEGVEFLKRNGVTIKIIPLDESTEGSIFNERS